MAGVALRTGVAGATLYPWHGGRCVAGRCRGYHFVSVAWWALCNEQVSGVPLIGYPWHGGRRADGQLGSA
eukprot:12927730-Prorocentrum_lima.AAC.1